MTKQKTETNITQPRGFGGATWVDATRIHTKPPNTCTDGGIGWTDGITFLLE